MDELPEPSGNKHGGSILNPAVTRRGSWMLPFGLDGDYFSYMIGGSIFTGWFQSE
jgi:hypothetical protein